MRAARTAVLALLLLSAAPAFAQETSRVCEVTDQDSNRGNMPAFSAAIASRCQAGDTLILYGMSEVRPIARVCDLSRTVLVQGTLMTCLYAGQKTNR